MTRRIVVMGVAGCGKSSVGAALSLRLNIAYRDGDDLHSLANVAKMRAGLPLTDDDRWPWLDAVAATLRDDAPIIVGCSALKRAYRDRIRGAGHVQFVHLSGSQDLITARMAQRSGHYMPLALLDSQFAALEAPTSDEAIIVDIDHSLSTIIDTIFSRL